MARSQSPSRIDIVLAAGVFALIGIMLVPLPGWVLDLLLAASFGTSLLLFLAALTARRAVELSTFPTLLLIATLVRLGLNVASTRVILRDGAHGTHAAGRVIEAFGQFVVGGNAAIGIVVFAILVVINFVVITKGAGRVAEVSARFALDAMPGKQMAIDAELNAGLIDEKVARARRAEVAREADFYGAMDGASKFVRGDAVAGILITVVNLVGGAFIGMMQHDMALGDALHTFAILTIGDGLAGQVPALIVSTAAGLLVTRVDDADSPGLAEGVRAQIAGTPHLLYLGAGVVGLFALVPGLTIPFAAVALALFGMGRMVAADLEKPTPLPAAAPVRPSEMAPEDLLPVDALAIEVAADLLYLVDERHGAELLQRIAKVRRQFATDLGLVLPAIHVRDDLDLPTGGYRIVLRGEPIGSGRLQARQHMALDPGGAKPGLGGVPGQDPVFGLPATWIPAALVQRANDLGHTVVDVPTVVTTHLVELMHVHGAELFDAGQLDAALERVTAKHPKLVEDLVPEPVPRFTLLRVLRGLLKEDVSVRDLVGILEALSEVAGRAKDPDLLVELVRQRLARPISRRFAAPDNTLPVVTFSPAMEDVLLRSLLTKDGSAPTLGLDPQTARHLIIRARELTESHAGATQAVLLCPPLARGAVRKLIERALPRLPVLSAAELVPSIRLTSVGVLDVDKALKAS